jgi:hypothetical protein
LSKKKASSYLLSSSPPPCSCCEQPTSMLTSASLLPTPSVDSASFSQIRHFLQYRVRQRPHAWRRRRQCIICQHIHPPRVFRQKNLRMVVFQVPPLPFPLTFASQYCEGLLEEICRCGLFTSYSKFLCPFRSSVCSSRSCSGTSSHKSPKLRSSFTLLLAPPQQPYRSCISISRHRISRYSHSFN